MSSDSASFHPPAPAPPRRSLALSPSRAKDYLRCPLRYRLSAIDRLPQPSTRAQLKGTVVHTVLEELYGKPREEREPETAVALLPDAWATARADDGTAREAVAPDDDEVFLAEAEKLVRRYYTMDDPRRFDPHALEHFVSTTLPVGPENGTPVRGFIDRVDVAPTGEVRVVDYKTGKRPAPRFQEDALYQMRFYALLWLRLHGELPTQLKLMYLATGNSLILAPQRAELERFERDLGSVWQRIVVAGRNGDFPARPHRLCDWCPFQKTVCPAFGHTPPDYPGWPD